MNGQGLAIMRQIHSADVLCVNSSTIYDFEPEVDAIITDKPGLILGIQTADCVPVLFACRTGAIIGAAHAGWKGAKAGIVANVVRAMRDLGAQEIVAIIGPSIQQRSYEVSLEYYERFLEDDASYARFFIKASSKDKKLFDLPGYVESKLIQAGVIDVTRSTDDTYTATEQYHSYRRSCHTDEEYNGHLLSAIMIR